MEVVEVVEAVQAVQRCFGEDVQQCLDACPRSLRVRNRERYVSQVNAVKQTDGPRRLPQPVSYTHLTLPTNRCV